MKRFLVVASVVVLGALFVWWNRSSKEVPPAPPPKAPPAKASPPKAADPKGTPPTAGKAAPPKREASKQEIETAIADLTKKIEKGAKDPTNPWAMLHGLIVFGKSMKATDGRLAIDAMVTDFVLQSKVDGKTRYSFPPRTTTMIPVDPHGNMIVKALLEAGVKPSRAFKLKTGGKVTLKQLIADAEASLIIPSANKDWHKFAWSHQMLMDQHKRQDAVDTKTGRKTMLEFALRAVHELEEHQQELMRLMDEAAPDKLKKDRTGIYAHPCGGLHFVQSTARAALHQNDEIMLRRVREQLEVVLFRWEGERRLYKSIAASRPDARLIIYVQEMKFYGHVLETFGLANEWGVLKLTDDHKMTLRQVAADLIDAIKNLQVAYDNLPKVKETSAQTYYDLIGDGCHAVRGLRLGLVASSPS